MIEYKKISISISKYCCVVSAYFLLIINLPFHKAFYDFLGGFHTNNILYIISVYIELFFIIYLFFYLISIPFLTKFLTLLLLIPSSFVTYAVLTYHVKFDSSIIRSILETNFIEAFSFLSIKFVFLLFYQIFVLFIIYYLKILYPASLKKFIFKKICTIILFCVFSVVFVYQNRALFNTFFAETPVSELLKDQLNPINYISSLKHYYKEKYSEFVLFKDQHQKFIKFDVQRKNPPNPLKKKLLIIFVLGESARSKSFSLNGYERKTNPELEKKTVISFTNFFSCGTLTNVSVPCMFSNFGRKNYNLKAFHNTENLLEILERSFFSVVWFDNGMGSHGVTRHIKEVQVGSFYKATNDFELIRNLPTKAELQQHPQDRFIILHQRGSHGPNYSSIYTEEFRKFTPDCKSSDIQSCSKESLRNSYDNSILWTDSNLNEIINYLKNMNDINDTAMIYVSDHGESTGEYGMYMHGLPYIIAPDNQIHIPFIVWFSEGFTKLEHLDTICLTKEKENNYSHDNIFHSILGLLDIQTSAYQKRLEIFSPCKWPHVVNNFRR